MLPHAARHPGPVFGECSLLGAASRIIASYEYAILPLWRDDDPAGSFVAIEVYDGIDSHRIPDWTKVALKGEARALDAYFALPIGDPPDHQRDDRAQQGHEAGPDQGCEMPAIAIAGGDGENAAGDLE